MSNFNSSPFDDLAEAAKSQSTNFQPADPWNAPPPYRFPTVQADQAGTEYLQVQQEEHERKDVALDRCEQVLQQTHAEVDVQSRVANFPPLLSLRFVKQFFYQDISLEIPKRYQRIVKANYCHFFAFCLVAFLNLCVSVAYYAVSKSNKIDNKSGRNLIFAVGSVFLLPLVGFLCDFRTVYNAFRTNKSAFFIMYFINFSIQFIGNIIRCVGFNGSGTVGYLTGVDLVVNHQYHNVLSANIMGVFMIVIGVMFTFLAVSNVILFHLVLCLFTRSEITPVRFREAMSWEYATNSRPTVPVQQTTETCDSHEESDVPLMDGSHY